MPTAWVAAPQDTLLDQVAVTLDGPQRSGAALVGADGVGKTLVARRAAEKFAAEHPIELVDGPRLIELVNQALGPKGRRETEPAWF